MLKSAKSVLFACLLVLPCLLFGQDSYTLKVNFVIGTVEVMDEVHAPEKGWIPAQYKMELDRDTKIRTGPNSRVELTGGGNKFKIGQKTSVKLGNLVNTPGSAYTGIQVITGKIFARCQALLKSGDRIEIMTPNAVAGVRGTEFVVGYEGDTSTVDVFKGEVEFADIKRSGYPVRVGPDQMSVLKDPAVAPESPRKIPASVYQEWGVEVPQETIVASAVTQQQAQTVEQTAGQGNKLSNAEIIEMNRKKNLAGGTATNVKPQTAPMTNLVRATQAMTNRSQPTQKAARENQEKEQAPASASSKPRFGMNANMGPINIDDKNYQQFVLMPEFSVGKFGIGLYIPAFIDPMKNAFEVSNWYNYSDWDFKGWMDGMHDVLMKILYVRWGEKGDPVFVRAGSIDQYTIGYGFLMYRFSNMLRFPVERKIGFQLDINTKYAGMETLVQDVFKGEIFGGRVFVHPLAWLDMRLLQKFDVGYSRIVDARPIPGSKWSHTIQHWDFDAGIPVARSQSVEVLLYTGYGSAEMMLNGTNRPYLGSAFVAGTKGHLSLFQFLLEYRNLANGYLPEYFDANYDNLRGDKYAALFPGFLNKDAFDDQNGILGKAGLALEKYGSFSLTYWQNLNSPVLDNDMSVLLDLKKGVIPKFYGTITYEKYNVKSFKDLFKNFFDYRTTITVEGIYSFDSTVDLGIVLKRTYIRNSIGGWSPLTTISFETRFGLFGVKTPPAGIGI